MYDYSRRTDRLIRKVLAEYDGVNRYVQECILGRFSVRVRNPTPEDEQMAFKALCHLKAFLDMLPVQTDEKALAISYHSPYNEFISDFLFCYHSLATKQYCQACEFLGEYLDNHPLTQSVIHNALSTLLDKFVKGEKYEYGF